MPVLSASDSLDVGLALSNPVLESASATLIARDYSGTLIQGPGITNPKTLLLPPQSQIALLASEIFGAGISTGWVEVQLSSPDVQGFFLLFDSRISFMDGAALSSVPTNRLIFPKVTSNPSTANWLTLINTGDQAINRVAISLFENSGRLVAQGYFPLQPRAVLSGRITDLFVNLGPFDGYAVAEATALPVRKVLVGLETYQYRSDIAVLNAANESVKFRTGYFPHLTSQGGYSSTLALVNFGNESQTLRITAVPDLDNQSNLPSSMTVERSIPPNGRLEERLDQMFGLSGDRLITGYVQYETVGNGNGLTGYLEFSTPDGLLLSAVSVEGESYSDLSFSHVAEGSGFYTGVAFLNANKDYTVVTVDTLDHNGHRVASTALSLAPGERRARLLRELSPAAAGQLGGTVHITASNPIFALQLFGTESLTVLSNISVRGSLLQPQASSRGVSSQVGASVLSADGSALVAIPPGALAVDTTVEIKPVMPSDLPKPSPDEHLAGAVDILPAGTSLRIPVRITIPLGSPLSPGSELPLLIFQPLLNRYDRSEFVGVVTPSGRSVSAEVSRFTSFAVAVPDAQPADPAVKILSLAPTTGGTGTTVVIFGSGFSPNPTANTVAFEGKNNTNVAATVVSAAETSLAVTVPPGSLTGTVFVQVGQVISNGLRFTVVDPIESPAVTAITPPGVLVGERSAIVSIAGTGFSRTSIVRYDGSTLTPVFIDSTALKLMLQEDQLLAGIHRLTVSNVSESGVTSNIGAAGTNGGEIESGAVDFVVANPVPSISGVVLNPILGGGRVQVMVNGSGFVSSSRIQIDGSRVDSTYVDAGTIILTVPSAPGIYLVTGMNAAPGGLSNGVVALTNQAPVVSAGSNQTISLPASAILSGTVSDDGLGTALSVTWSKVSGSGTVTFQNPNALNTTATFSAAGTYVLWLTASDGFLYSTSDVTITVIVANRAPAVSVGPSQVMTLLAPVKLVGTATDDGLPFGSALTVMWTKVSGPGTVTFANARALSTTATFSTAGTYVLRLTASDSEFSSSADVTIIVTPPNQAPVVSASANRIIITLPAAANLSGTATDDGLPLGSTLTVTWSQVSGSGPVTFGNPNALTTTAMFSTAGIHVLRLTATDGALAATTDVTVIVNAIPITSAAIYPPPTSGSYTYAAFTPGTPGFPALGETYVDPIFGSVIRRITNDYPAQNNDDIYGKNGFWNANGTLFMHHTLNDREFIDTTTGAAVRTGVPAGDNGVIASDASFDPVDPDAWYYFSGSSLMKYSLSSGTSSTIKTFSGTLHQVAGGAENWIDRTGRYFLVSYDDGSRHPVAHLWDKQTNTIYASSLDSTFVEADNGYLALTPDAKYIVAAGSGGSSRSHYSYPVDHTNKSISSTGTFFWSLCGQHGAFVSASDGKDYYFSYDCDSTPAVYRVDITIPQTAGDFNKQHNDNLKLVDLDWKDDDPHFSCTAKGSNSDWCFFNTETSDDLFNNMGPWRPYKQEIIGVNVITGEVRRLAHHRSRNIVCTGCIYGGYYYQPRISVSWDGTKVAWASNYGYNASPAEYADIYTLELPALAQFASAPGTRFLVAKAEAEDVDVGLDSTAKISSPDRSWKAEWQGPLVFAIPQTSPAIKRAN